MSGLPERGVGDGSEGDESKKATNPPVSSSGGRGDDDSSQNLSGACSQPIEGGKDNPLERVNKIEASKSTIKHDRSPNAEILNQIISMGISKEKAIRALYLTGNNSVEAAISWIFENNDSGPEAAEIGNLDAAPFQEYKMVFAVNCSLNMGVGKTAAQVAHAALGLQMFLLENDKIFGCQLTRWNETGETKVVLKAENAEQLNILAAKAQSFRLPNYLVADAGRTQIPAGSVTVLSIFGPIDLVDQVTGQLKLL
ncbi:probable peptidyl-tRNA hydrolase 2 [Panonychus citri]|uniref:probable peptidyl-tRNA hydrolase 2 n=1 Tax=Panonychus citri TaxID=50023 RepID=UPI0023079452|nr:probable peptidyl-tRNA hydrolase 2 [Panonychus citri]